MIGSCAVDAVDALAVPVLDREDQHGLAAQRAHVDPERAPRRHASAAARSTPPQTGSTTVRASGAATPSTSPDPDAECARRAQVTVKAARESTPHGEAEARDRSPYGQPVRDHRAARGARVGAGRITVDRIHPPPRIMIRSSKPSN